jgi:phenylacetate-CoA ligase
MIHCMSTATGTVHPACQPDFVSRDELRDVQLRRLRDIVGRAYTHVELYRQRMDELGVHPDDLRTLEDVVRLPLTVKDDLRDTYPVGLFASPMQEIVRLHASSGTTGKPIVVGYTRSDIEVWTNVMLRALAGYGLHAGDIVQNAYGYGLFTGGLGIHYGAEALGATVIPISGGNTDRQIMMMKDFGVSAICCTPSYFLHILDRAQETGVDLRAMPLRAGCFGAEPWTAAMRCRIENAAGIRAFDIYGLTEVVGPGVGAECQAQDGLHLFEDHFLPEIIDPETLQPLPDGAEGELVLTTLSKQATPMIRYRTRDITSLMTEPCACGRMTRRIRRISHRSDDMFIVRGVNVFPSQIETAILKLEGTLPHYQIFLTRQKDLDQIEVRIEVTPEVLSDRVGAMEALQERLSHQIEQTIGLRVTLRLIEPHSIERSQGKAKRVFDQRGL